jgi:hypothetical protein
MQNVFGVPHQWFILIALFWIALAVVILGSEVLYDNAFVMVLVFLTIGTSMLIGHFGWEVLILPSLVVLSVVAVLIWMLFFSR